MSNVPNDISDEDYDFDLDVIAAQRAEAMGLKSSERGKVIRFKSVGGVWEMPHPLFQSDEWNDELAQCESPSETGIHVLGEDQYERYVEAGGSGQLLGFLLQEANKLAIASDDEGRPTRPSRSSRRTPKRRK